jgi:hypothetical protein
MVQALLAASLPGGEQARIDGQFDAACLARLQLDLAEGAKALGRFPARRLPVRRAT